MGRLQASVRYNDLRGDRFTLYAYFDTEREVKLFYCISKCLECRSRGLSEKEGLRKFPEFQDVMNELTPLRLLPVGFENQSKEDKKSTLAKLASERAEEASAMYDQIKAAAPASGGQFSGASTSRNGGTEIQPDNPEGRPPTFSDEQLMNMLFSNLKDRASSYHELSLLLLAVKSDVRDWLDALEMKERLEVDSRSSPVQPPELSERCIQVLACLTQSVLHYVHAHRTFFDKRRYCVHVCYLWWLLQGGAWDASHPCREDMAMENGHPDVASVENVATSLELVSRLTGQKRANEGDLYPPVDNGAEDFVQQQPMKRLMENPMPPSPLGSQLEGSGIHGGGENVRSPISQMIYEFDKEQLQLFELVDEGQQHDHDVLAQEGE